MKRPTPQIDPSSIAEVEDDDENEDYKRTGVRARLFKGSDKRIETNSNHNLNFTDDPPYDNLPTNSQPRYPV